MKDLQKQKLKEFFRGKVLYDTPLKDFVSFKAGGPAAAIAFPEDVEDLTGLYRFLQEEKIAFFVMGEGTNVLVRDGGFKGVVIKLSSGFTSVSLDSVKGKGACVKAQAGGRLSRILSFSIENSLAGLEFASGIPGSVGGAVAMNAGAYGGEIKDVVASIGVLTSHGLVHHLEGEALQFSYRKLSLPPNAIIVEVMFEFARGNRQEIAALMQENLDKRKANQPLDLPSAGSVFKNPHGYYAAQIIEALGFKGYQIGGAAVSERHANYIVNRGSARAEHILELITVIQEKAWQEKGIKLEPEIKVVGDG